MTTSQKSRRRATPDAVPTDSVGRDVLEARCAALEPAVSKQEGITPELMATYKPGGSANPDQSATGVLTYLQWLTGQYAQGPKAPKAHNLRYDTRAMEDMRAAMAREPIYLTLESGRRVGVFPKGEAGLNRLVVNQCALQWAEERRVALQSIEDHTVTTLELLRDVTRLVEFLTGEFVAILTDPTPYVPWEDTGEWEHPIPSWVREVTPFDLLALRAAYLDVNLLRINAIAERSRQYAAHGGEPMPIAVFLGVMSDEMKVKPEDMARLYSLGEVFAIAYAKFEAMERAKARAEDEKPK